MISMSGKLQVRYKDIDKYRLRNRYGIYIIYMYDTEHKVPLLLFKGPITQQKLEKQQIAT